MLCFDVESFQLVQQRKELRKMAFRLQNLRKSKAFAAWNVILRDLRRKRKDLLLQARISYIARQVSKNALWHDNTSVFPLHANSREQRGVMGGGRGRAALVLAYRRWRERVKEDKHTNLHVMKMLKRLLICSLRQSFDAWLSHIFEKQQHTAEALNAAWRHMKSAHAKVHTRQKHIEWQTRLELLQKVHLAFIANAFAHWMNGKMNSGTSAAWSCSRLCLELPDSSTSAAHSGTSRLGESTEKLLTVWSNVTCIQALRLWYEHTIEQSMLRLSSTLLLDGSTDNTQALAWDLWRWKIRRRRVAKNFSLGWSNRTCIQALRRWNEHARLQRKLREAFFASAMFLVYGGALFLANGPEG
jgi:hypothetical protein